MTTGLFIPFLPCNYCERDGDGCRADECEGDNGDDAGDNVGHPAHSSPCAINPASKIATIVNCESVKTEPVLIPARSIMDATSFTYPILLTPLFRRDCKSHRV